MFVLACIYIQTDSKHTKYIFGWSLHTAEDFTEAKAQDVKVCRPILACKYAIEERIDECADDCEANAPKQGFLQSILSSLDLGNYN